MKKIKLTQNKTTIVDDNDFDVLSQHKWCFDKSVGYAVSRINGENMRMHRFILKPKSGELCDHINRNKLDNRRVNLRTCAMSGNVRNRPKQSNNRTGFKGVYEMSDRKKKYLANIRHCGKTRFLGYYYTKTEAASAYNTAAIEFFGQFAYLNKI